MIQLLKDIAEVSAGQGAPQGDENYSEYGIPFVKAGNLSELINGTPITHIQKVSDIVAKKHRLRLFPEGTVLFAKSGMSCLKGYVYVLPCNAYVVNHLACIIPKESISDYLKYYFYYHKPNQLAKDGSYPSISLTDIENLPINVIEAEKRKHVISVLDTVGQLIVLYKQSIALYDRLIKARFVEMFGDVIHNSRAWKVCLLSEIASSRLGKMLDAKQQSGKCSFPYLANYNVQWFRFEMKSLNQMDFDEDDQIEFELRDGDLLVCEGGEIGRCAVWHNELQPCFFQKALHRVRCDLEVVHPDYLAWWFKYNCDHDGFASIVGAKATIAHLPGAKLKQLRVAVPPIDLQNQFADFVVQVNKSKAAVQRTLDKAQLLFDSLMQKYFG